jgi:hypothetical protein
MFTPEVALNGVPLAAERGMRPNPLNLIRIIPAEGLRADIHHGVQSSIRN